ncbi:hypothetical protein EM868_14110 [Cupriavidus gilardii]|jgi:hypothetical protein|uniref:Uncharacterized protein n=2 Tax=Cupriavidus TaxID=106589 RepID=A0A5A8EV07_9BURK|nr:MULTISPECIES: hypothetical protein [Cupriavidus]QQE07588.1 hypothetical protein IC580_04250 [Cupriavidus sp. ISTL7]KAA0181339.1 hypothetical protein FX016_11820 [Cupriavidus gilardii]KAA6118311.1 hypothetical protein F1599_22030 [Cupriavidus cauae]KAB0598529.1 hypothetical protein F7Q96_02920 [Cupriavidus gilardii]MBO4119963.1 hypothetical protein [Cupriavidus gilardii]
MRRYAKTRSELMAILNQCLDNNPECGECELHAVRVHQPDHTGCNWSAEVDFPRAAEDSVSMQLRAAKSIIVDMRQQYNVLQ